MQLINGDCLKVMKTIPDKSVDLCISDCPYKLGSKGGGIIKKRDYLKWMLQSLVCIAALSIASCKLALNMQRFKDIGNAIITKHSSNQGCFCPR